MFIGTQETVLFTTYPVHKTELLMVMCAVVRLRGLMARQAARLITNPSIETRNTSVHFSRETSTLEKTVICCLSKQNAWKKAALFLMNK
jgi:hypothetical protein